MAGSSFDYESLAPYNVSLYLQMTPEARKIIKYIGYFSSEDISQWVPSYLPVYTRGRYMAPDEPADYTDLHNRLIEHYSERTVRSQGEAIESFVSRMEAGPELSQAELRQKKIEWVKAQGHETIDPNAGDWSWEKLYRTYGPGADISDELEIPIWREIISHHYQNRPQQAISTYLEVRQTGEAITFFDLETFGSFGRDLNVNNYFVPHQATFTQAAFNEDGTVKFIGSSETLLINPKTSKQWRRIEESIGKLEHAARQGNVVQLTDAEYRTMRDLIKYSEAQFDEAGRLTALTSWVDELIPEEGAVDLAPYVEHIRRGLEVLEERGVSVEELIDRYNEMVLQGGIIGGQNIINYDIQAMSVLAQAEGLDDIAVPTRVLDTLQLNRSIFNNPLEQIYEGNVPSYGLLTQDSLRVFWIGKRRFGTYMRVDVEQNIEILGLMHEKIDERLETMRAGLEYFSFDDTPLRRGDYLFAEFGRQRYGEAAADIIYEKPPKDWLDRSTPKLRYRKTFYRVEDAFRAEGRSNIVLRNLYTDQLHVISRESDEALQSYVQEMFRYVGDWVDPDELAAIKEHYERDLARQRYRNFFRQEGGFKQAKLFFDALDIEDEQLLAQHFRSKQQLRDFHYLRARLESEAPIVRPMLERIDAHFRGAPEKANRAMVILGVLLDERFGLHQEEIVPLPFEGFSVEIPTMTGELTRVQIPNLQRGADNLWWAIYNQTRGRNPAAQQAYIVDIIDRLARENIITQAERQEILDLRPQGTRYQVQHLAGILTRHQPDLQDASILVEALTPRNMQIAGDPAQVGLEMAEYAIGLVNRLDWQGTEVQRILAELSEEASKTLPLDFEYDLQQNIKDIAGRLSSGSSKHNLEGAGVVVSLTNDGRVVLAVGRASHAESIEASLLRGRPSKHAAYIELPVPDRHGVVTYRGTRRAAIGRIRHRGNKYRPDRSSPFSVEFSNVMDEITESIDRHKWNIWRALEEGDIGEVQRQLNKAVYEVMAELPDVSRGVTSQGVRYVTMRDIDTQSYIDASGLAPIIAKDLGLHNEALYQGRGVLEKGYLELDDLTLYDKMRVVQEAPRYIEELFGLKVNTASVKGEHVADMLFATTDVRRRRALGWFSVATRPNFLQMGRTYQLERDAVESIRRSGRLSISPGLVSSDELQTLAERHMMPSRVSMNVALVSDDIIKRYYTMAGIKPGPVEWATTYENMMLIRRSEMPLFDGYQLKSVRLPDVLPDEITFSDAIHRAQAGEEVILNYGDLIAEYRDRTGELIQIRYDERTPGIVNTVDLAPGTEHIDIRVAMPTQSGAKFDIAGEKGTIVAISDEIMDELVGRDISALYSSNIAKHRDYEAAISGQINRVLWHIENLPEPLKPEARERFLRHFNRITGLTLTADAWVPYFGEMAFEVPSDPEFWEGKTINPEDVVEMLRDFGLSETRILPTGDEVVVQRLSVGRTIVDEHLYLHPALGYPLDWERQDVGVKFGPRQMLAINEEWGLHKTADYILNVANPDHTAGRRAYESIVYALTGTPEDAVMRSPREFIRLERGYDGYTEDMLKGSILVPEEGSGVWLRIPEVTVQVGQEPRTISEIYIPAREFGFKETGSIELDRLQQQAVRIHNLALEYEDWMRIPEGIDPADLRGEAVIRAELAEAVREYYDMLTSEITGKEGDVVQALTVRMPASGHGRYRLISPEVPRVQTVFTERDWEEIFSAPEGEHLKLYHEKLNKYQKLLGQQIIEEGTHYISPEYAYYLATDPVTGYIDEELLDALWNEGVYGLGLREPVFFQEAAQTVRYKVSEHATGTNIYVTPGIADIQQGDSDGDINEFMLAYSREYRKEKGWERTADSIAAEEELRKAHFSKDMMRRRLEYARSATESYQKKYARFDHILFGPENIQGLKDQGLDELAIHLMPGASTSTVGAVHVDPTWGRHIDIETPTIGISRARARMLGLSGTTAPVIGVASAGGAPGRQLSAIQLVIDENLSDTDMRISDVTAHLLGVDDGSKIVIAVPRIGQEVLADEFLQHYTSGAGQIELEAAKQLNIYGSSARLAADLNENIKEAASRLEERRALSGRQTLNERLQTLANLASLEGGAFRAFIGPEIEADIMHSKLGKMGIGYLSNINMQIRQLAHAVRQTSPEVFERIMTGIDDPVRQIAEFGRILEQEFIDVKHGEINLASRRAPHESIEVGRAIRRGDFDFIRRITKRASSGEQVQVFSEQSIEAMERLYRLLNDSGQWDSHVGRIFLSDQFNLYAGGASGLLELIQRKDDQLLTPYFRQLLEALGEEQPDLHKQVQKLIRIAPDSMELATRQAAEAQASRRAIREGLQDLAGNSARSGLRTLRNVGLVGAALAGSYLVASFFRPDPLQPEKQPIADTAPDVTGTYDPDAEPLTAPGFDEYTIARQQSPQLAPSPSQGEQVAYVTPNTGYSIKVRARGNVPKERVGALTQQALQQGGEIPVSMNLTITDNTEDIDVLWMQEQVARAIEDGYAY